MSQDLLHPLKLLLAAAMLAGCTPSLDFDATQGGDRPSGDGDSGDGDSGDGDSGDGDSQGKSFSCDDFEDAQFCDDFDGKLIGAKWDELLIFPDEDSGVVENSSEGALSGENCLLAEAYEDIAQDTYVSFGVKKTFGELAGKSFHAEVSFDMKVEQYDRTMNRRATAFQFLFGSLADGYNQLTFNLQSRGSSVASQFTENQAESAADGGGSSSVDHDFKAGVPDVAQWTHVKFTLDVAKPSGGKNEAVLVVGNTTLFDGELKYELQEFQPRFELGIPWVDTTEEASQNWRIRYDNVLVNIEEI